METKYGIGDLVYLPFKIYRIEIDDEIRYIARGCVPNQHLTVCLREEEVDSLVTVTKEETEE
jgi:hypothetical protein